jgi:hypothetical protein
MLKKEVYIDNGIEEEVGDGRKKNFLFIIFFYKKTLYMRSSNGYVYPLYFDPRSHPRQPPFLRPKRGFRKTPDYSGFFNRWEALDTGLERLYEEYSKMIFSHKYDDNEEKMNELKIRLRDVRDEMEYYGYPIHYTDESSYKAYRDAKVKRIQEISDKRKEEEKKNPPFDYFNPKTYPKQPPFPRPKREYKRTTDWSYYYCLHHQPMKSCFEKLYKKYFTMLYDEQNDEESRNELKLRIQDLADEMKYYDIEIPFTDECSYRKYCGEKRNYPGFLSSTKPKPEIEILEEYDDDDEEVDKKDKVDVKDKVEERSLYRKGSRGKSRYAGGGYGKSSWI